MIEPQKTPDPVSPRLLMIVKGIMVLLATLSAALVMRTWQYTQWLALHAKVDPPIEPSPVDLSLTGSVASLVFGTLAIVLLVWVARHAEKAWALPSVIATVFFLLPYALALAYLAGRVAG